MGRIHWTGIVLLVLIIHITFNSMRNPEYTFCPEYGLPRKFGQCVNPGCKGSPTWWASWWASFVKEWAYEHPSLIEQLNMGWRTFELDFHMRFLQNDSYSMIYIIWLISYAILYQLLSIFQAKISFILSCSNVGPVINLYLLSHLLETHQRLVRSKPKTFPAL